LESSNLLFFACRLRRLLLLVGFGGVRHAWLGLC
jgi:hypothetical protein